MIDHKITTPIFYNDVIEFGLAFTATAATTSSTLQKDSGRCTVQINTKDDRYWLQTVEDGYYLDAAAPTYYIDATNDWQVYQEDDDDDRFC